MMLLDQLDGILNYCRTKVPLGVVVAINGNIKSLPRPSRGYKNLRYLLLKVQRMAAPGLNSWPSRKQPELRASSDFLRRALIDGGFQRPLANEYISDSPCGTDWPSRCSNRRWC
jgi:hypothetical protein